MPRKRLLLLVVLGLVAGVIVVLRLGTPSNRPEQPPPPPVVQRREPALQADAEGYYVPGYQFTVNRFRFTSFTLRPEALVTFAETSTRTERAAGCVEALIRTDAVRLQCDYPQVGVVTIEGHFSQALSDKPT